MYCKIREAWSKISKLLIEYEICPAGAHRLFFIGLVLCDIFQQAHSNYPAVEHSLNPCSLIIKSTGIDISMLNDK